MNRWGLAELLGELYEWCEDGWHPNPVQEGCSEDGEPWRGEDGELVRRESGQRGWTLIRGGSWFHGPPTCRAAFRGADSPSFDFNF